MSDDVFKELDKMLQSLGRPVQMRAIGPDGIGIERRRALEAMRGAALKEREEIAKMMDAEAKQWASPEVASYFAGMAKRVRARPVA